jgi:hypothetical protein
MRRRTVSSIKMLAVVLVIISCLSVNAVAQDERELIRGVHEMVEVRRANIDRLLQIVAEKESYSNEEVTAAMLALGEYRATEAVPVLVDNIGYQAKPLPNGWALSPMAYNAKEYAPAMYAIVQIGLPAIDPLFRLLATGGDERSTMVAYVATGMILGAKHQQLYLQALIEESQDAEEIGRLRRYVP